MTTSNSINVKARFGIKMMIFEIGQ
jgi:hypothetical protein